MIFTNNNTYNFYNVIIDEKDLIEKEFTLSNFLYEKLNISVKQIRELKKNCSLKVNKNIISLNAKLRKNDVIEFKFKEKEHFITPYNLPIKILYEDNDIICVNKTSNIVVHPTTNHLDKTLANAIRFYSLNKNEDFKPRLINRLDRDTTGIIIFGKNPHSQNFIQKEIKENIKKKYLAIVEGNLKNKEGIIDLPIYKDGENIKRIVSNLGKKSITKYKVIESFNGYDLVDIELITGRTHQIRVHFSYLNHPLVGDELYGANIENSKNIIDRQALHSYYLELKSPRIKEKIILNANIPDDMLNFLNLIK